MTNQWNAAEYDARHAFVYEKARGLVELLAPKAGERLTLGHSGCPGVYCIGAKANALESGRTILLPRALSISHDFFR